MTTTSTTLGERIQVISSSLRNIAATITQTSYSSKLEEMAPEAQDLYQVAVAEILQNCSQKDNNAYMLNLARWRMQNAARSEHRRFAFIVDGEITINGDDEEGETADLLEVIVDEETDPETLVIQSELDEQVRDLFRDLKPEQAIVVKLIREGFSLIEISRKLGITDRTLRYRIAAIREALAPKYAPALALA